VRFNERILKDGRPIDDARLADCLERCERANAGQPITFFEITTAAAFLAFADAPADWVLLETGLGGRLDATNVVARPRLVLISTIAMDHESYLGDRLEAIAYEKAGILKPGVPAVIGRQPPAALAVIERRAAAIDAPLLVHGRDWQAEEQDGRLTVETGTERLDLPRPALAGVHQIDNGGLAVMAACRLAEAGLDRRAIAEGLTRAQWPARLQRLGFGPMLDLLPPGTALWLDGGHNPAAGEALALTFRPLAERQPLHLIVGMLTTKDLAAFLRPLVPLAASLRFVPVPGESLSRDPEDSARLARELGVPAVAADSALAAVAEIAAQEPPPCQVLICGSLYLAGDVLRRHG
jgi:dihydrofolate synthase/folylpolyglutamate synthase